MKGIKILDRTRVRLLVDLRTKGGVEFKAGEVVTFRRAGVVIGSLKADDGRSINGNFDRDTFEVLDAVVARLAGYRAAK